MTRVLISGASGALGASLSVHLERSGGFEIHSLPRSKVDFEAGPEGKGRLKAILAEAKPDLIFHLAASLSENFDVAFAVNVLSTRWFCECLSELRLSCRLVVIGSAAEYGVVAEADNPIRETQPLRPITMYGLSKVWQTHLAMMYATHGLDVVIARLFNLDSPMVSRRLFAGRLKAQIDELKAGTRQRLEFGSLSAIRDYIDVDTALQQLLLISSCGLSGEVYHVASGRPVTMLEFLRSRIVAEDLPVHLLESVQPLSNHHGTDVPIVYASIEKTCRLERDCDKHGRRC